MGLLDKIKNKKEEPKDMYLYKEEEIDQYEKYITNKFGEFKEVFHEIVSPDIHLDILIIPPTKENNYYKLITMGMGAYKMNVPKELKKHELERAELVLCLPPDWNIKSNKEEDYWPIRQLKILGRLPIDCNTWLGFGHTVSSDEKNTPYASNTKFCSMLLLNALDKDYNELDFKMKEKGRINFYQLFPLYEEELNYKFKNGLDNLGSLFSDGDMMPIVNLNRKNYCKK